MGRLVRKEQNMNLVIRRGLSRSGIQKLKQASPIIQNQLDHETYTTFAVDEQFVLHLEQERLRIENNRMASEIKIGPETWPKPVGLNHEETSVYYTTLAKISLEK